MKNNKFQFIEPKTKTISRDKFRKLQKIPKSKLGIVIDGLDKTHKAGLRYPIPKYMNYNPEFQTSFEIKAKEKVEGTIIKE
ncbi:MAG: hypothetical protein ACFE9I_12195 [Candidatus Hermodarchaeota archaeon]